jgi:dipeptidyl aminopeptidase/acylaminoacyl peptidase
VISSLDYNGDTFSYLFAVKNGSSQDLYQYDRTSELTTLTPTNFFDRGQWIQDGTAYIGTQGNRYYLGVKTKDPVLQTNLFTAPEINKNTGLLNKQLFSEGRDVVRTFSVSPKRDKIYTVASLNYEPLAIWEYDVANKTLRNVVPERENQTAVPVITPVQAYITGTDGRKIDYYYLPPAGFEKGRKYPVVMDQFSDLGFQPNSQFLASAGIIYVAVFPYGVGRPDHPTDPEDTLAVYREMLKNPNVDPKRIYLFGESAGTGIITQLLEEHPELWRGAIMLSPVSFPSLESGKKMCRSIFFSFGEEDDMGSQARMENFVNEACGHLVRTQVEYGRAGHVFFDVAELKKRYKAIATFILTDY